MHFKYQIIVVSMIIRFADAAGMQESQLPAVSVTICNKMKGIILFFSHGSQRKRLY